MATLVNVVTQSLPSSSGMAASAPASSTAITPQRAIVRRSMTSARRAAAAAPAALVARTTLIGLLGRPRDGDDAPARQVQEGEDGEHERRCRAVARDRLVRGED